MTTHTLFPLGDIEPGTARKVTVEGHEIALVRIDDDVYAIGDTCSHAEVSLSEGFVEADDCMIECGRHGALFDLRTGEPASLPAVRPVPVYDVAVVDGMVRLTISDPAPDETETT
jgi:3-phenylpropionate/trans-cinnamate dioxygenase ferredoxin component